MPLKKPSYIFVSGGVLSSLGKGITTASIAFLLKSRGYKVTIVKCENYLNLDAGLINPIEHGDPFLCEDGTEADMDLGTYEKFLDQDMTRDNFVTLGQIYKSVIDRERAFGYHGEDVEVPQVCDEIIRRINQAGEKDQADIIITELGGTAGEYLNVLYYEASRILEYRNDSRVLHIHVSYLPTPPHIGEPKTKPTQLSVQRLNSMGIQPDFIIARSEQPMDERRRDRFALFCNVKPDHIITNPDRPSVYEIPLIFAKQKFDQKILHDLHLPVKSLQLSTWTKMVNKLSAKKKQQVTVAIACKYITTGEYELRDSYAALHDALNHAGNHLGLELNIKWLPSDDLEGKGIDKLKNVDGVIVPIGWGPRGVEGKINAIKFAREQKVPYLGLCYGMQLAVVEFARHVAGWKDANTTEVNPKSSHPVIHIIPEQQRILEDRAYGGTMRLGTWDCVVKPNSLAWNCYDRNQQFVNKDLSLTCERHRHRYEFNDHFLNDLEAKGLIIGGRSVKENLVELIELPKSVHPFFIGTQGHPEYKSRPLRPHGIFIEFLKAAGDHHQKSVARS
jgi:CTP synthase